MYKIYVIINRHLHIIYIRDYMRRLMLIFILLATTTSMAGILPMDAVMVYNKIIKTNNVINAPRLYLVNSDELNAVYRPSVNVIYITTRLLSDLQTLDEIASVLAHELAHALLRHQQSNIFTEFEADKYGAMYTRGIYGKCKGLRAIKRWDNPISLRHPSGKSRWNALGCR